MQEKVPTTVMRLTLPVSVMVGLRKQAHNRKCTVAHLVRQMIYHHLDKDNYAIYVGRPTGHKWIGRTRKIIPTSARSSELALRPSP